MFMVLNVAVSRLIARNLRGTSRHGHAVLSLHVVSYEVDYEP